MKFLKEESGTIGYSTCSVLKEENNDQVDYFCKEFGLKLASGGYF